MNNSKKEIALIFVRILAKYEVSIEESAFAMKENLPKEWEIFKERLLESEDMLKKAKEKFKTGLLSQSEDFKKQVGSLVSNFGQEGPFAANFG